MNMLTQMIKSRLFRAYALAYGSTTAPKLLNLVIHLFRRKFSTREALSSVSANEVALPV